MGTRAAVLTVSDSSSQDASLDKSGPKIQEILREAGITCSHSQIAPDDAAKIKEIILAWIYEQDVDLVLTTGGTGFGTRDVTPEAISPLLERQAPGIVHLLLSSSLKHTPFASLSRPVAGTCKETLIITLPGSVKAVTENLNALLEANVLGHAVELIRGGTGAAVHSTMADSTPVKHEHHHHHHHHHHGHSHDHKPPVARTSQALSQDTHTPVSARHRVSPYPLVSYEDAIERILTTLSPLKAVTQPVTPSLIGHVLAEDVYAPSDVPLTPTTSVDGYALSTTQPPGVYSVVTSSTHRITDTLAPDAIYRINTGAPLPTGTNTVIMVEDTRLIEENDGEETKVEILAATDPGENIRAPGSDTKRGDLVLRKGSRIASPGGEIGTLAFVGRQEVSVVRKPVIAILSTGNEIVDLQRGNPSGKAEWGGIWDTNRPSLQAAMEGLGYKVVDLGIVSDVASEHVDAMKRGLASADILVSTGGTSMGPSDLFKPVIEHELGGTIHFGRVTIKPGKPTTFATVPWEGEQKPVFALPGNPASALVTFHTFVLPALRRLGGWAKPVCQYPRVKVNITNAMNLDPRTEFHRVVIKATGSGLVAESTGGQRSSRAASMSGANGLAILPQQKEGGPKRLEAGETVDALVIGELQMA